MLFFDNWDKEYTDSDQNVFGKNPWNMYYMFLNCRHRKCQVDIALKIKKKKQIQKLFIKGDKYIPKFNTYVSLSKSIKLHESNKGISGKKDITTDFYKFIKKRSS